MLINLLYYFYGLFHPLFPSEVEHHNYILLCFLSLVFSEVQEMEELLTDTCEVTFPDPSCLHHFILTISPDTGYWQGGRFRFAVSVPEDYNIVVSFDQGSPCYRGFRLF